MSLYSDARWRGIQMTHSESLRNVTASAVACNATTAGRVFVATGRTTLAGRAEKRALLPLFRLRYVVC